VVYRVSWSDTELLDEFQRPFIGEFQKAGSDPAHLNNPRGLAVDRNGNILVADTGNDRILKFDFRSGALVDSVYSPTKAAASLSPGKSLVTAS
jgi:DNA-binding beta-propeller fold protein YncE